MIAELLRITAEVARLEYERELLCQQRDALLDGLWGKGAPAPEELPQVGDGIHYRAEDAVTDAAGNVTSWPAVSGVVAQEEFPPAAVERAIEGIRRGEIREATTMGERLAAEIVSKFMPPPEDVATKAQLDAGWRRVLDWRNANPFGSPPAEEGAE